VIDYLTKLISIGCLPHDSGKVILQKQSLCVMGYLMAVGGLVWGTLSIAYELYFPSLIPYSYTVLTVLNFLLFSQLKNFPQVRVFQLFISVLLPFLFQWSLGGFVPSGAVMIWAIIPLLASISFQNIQLAKRWLWLYLFLIVMSAWIDVAAPFQAVTVNNNLITLFFVLNISVVSATVIVLVTYFVEKENKAHHKLQLITRQIQISHEELETTLEVVNQQNKNIQAWKAQTESSINYAARIQRALLPLKADIQRYLPESFVFFKPRDVVSGDFYWFDKINGKLIITVADCTGHGVPGALMSMLGARILSEITSQHPNKSAGKYLEMWDLRIQQSLKQGQTQSRDGMDVGLVILDDKNQKLQFAGAKNPVFYVQNDKMNVIKGDKFSIGGRQSQSKLESHAYQTHQIELYTPTMIYLASDGYQDQFGGTENRKFMVKHFRQLLLDIYTHPSKKQKQILLETLQDWMVASDAKQTDDICVLGFRI